MSSLREKVKDLKIGAKKRRQDFDPEDDGFSKQVESDDGEPQTDISEDENIGREHYETVGKSKLRRPEKTKLDEKKYGGQAVSRDKIFRDDDGVDALAPDEDEDEDPFAAPAEDATGSEDSHLDDSEGVDLGDESLDGEVDEDDEIDSNEAFEDGEEDKFRGKGFVFRGSGQGLKELPTGGEEDEVSDDHSLSESGSGDEDQSDIDMGDVDDEGTGNDDELDTEEDEEEQTDTDGEEANARPRPSTIRQIGNTDREQLKALMSSDTANIASSLSASLSADAQKGAAVRKQYQTFDRLLDARIKLQKSLTASGSLYFDQSTADEEARAALQKAEEAALKLYATIESVRHTILAATTADQPSKKRKRPSPPTLTASTSDLWTRISTIESSTLQTRHQTLDKWSAKTRSATPISTASKLNGTSTTDPKLTSVLDAYLSTETQKHLSPALYDDSQFYQSLLRDLINSRSALSNTTNTLPAVPLKLHPSGNTARSAKVDTKASKGRKVRYTVHEKLENFMAGEGRGNAVGQWNDGAVREFFASLLGQRGLLGEGDESMNVNGEEEDGEVEALRLFGQS